MIREVISAGATSAMVTRSPSRNASRAHGSSGYSPSTNNPAEEAASISQPTAAERTYAARKAVRPAHAPSPVERLPRSWSSLTPCPVELRTTVQGVVPPAWGRKSSRRRDARPRRPAPPGTRRSRTRQDQWPPRGGAPGRMLTSGGEGDAFEDDDHGDRAGHHDPLPRSPRGVDRCDGAVAGRGHGWGDSCGGPDRVPVHRPAVAAPVGRDRPGGAAVDAGKRDPPAAQVHHQGHHDRRRPGAGVAVAGPDRLRASRLVQLRLDRQRRKAQRRPDRPQVPEPRSRRPDRDGSGDGPSSSGHRAEPLHPRRGRRGRDLVSGRVQAPRGSDPPGQPVAPGLADHAGQRVLDPDLRSRRLHHGTEDAEGDQAAGRAGGRGTTEPRLAARGAHRGGGRTGMIADRHRNVYVELFWIPLGAGGWFVRLNGRLYEAVQAFVGRRRPLDLYQAALEVHVPEGRFVIENAWPIPKAAVGGPRRVTDDLDAARRVLDLTGSVPPLVWGPDELGAGEMWNSNSVVAWLLARSGIRAARGVVPATAVAGTAGSGRWP